MSRSLISSLKSTFDRRHVGTIAFRLVARCDSFPLFEATQHPDFNRFLLWPAPQDARDVTVQVDKMIRENSLDRAVLLSLCDRLTGTWIGIVRLQAYRDGLEFGLYLHPNSWSNGVVASAGRAVVETLIESVGDLPIYIRVRLGNVKMEKVCAFYKFEKVDRVTDTHLTDGPVELDLYQVRKDLWVPYTDIVTY